MSFRQDRELGGIRVIAAGWPVIIIDFPQTVITDESLRMALSHVESLLVEATRSKEKLYLVTDLTRMRQIPTGQRESSAEWLKRISPLARVATLGGATVTSSAILRGIITAVFWIQAPPTPFFSVATLDEAMAKGIDLFEAAHVALPRALMAYRRS